MEICTLYLKSETEGFFLIPDCLTNTVLLSYNPKYTVQCDTSEADDRNGAERERFGESFCVLIGGVAGALWGRKACG